MALEHFRSELYGIEFTILTDHKLLLSFQKRTEFSDMEARWHTTLNKF